MSRDISDKRKNLSCSQLLDSNNSDFINIFPVYSTHEKSLRKYKKFEFDEYEHLDSILSLQTVLTFKCLKLSCYSQVFLSDLNYSND